MKIVEMYNSGILGNVARRLLFGCLLLTAYCSLAPAQVMDRINRGCGGLGGTLVQVLTDASGNIYMITCTGKQVFINGSPITPGGPSGSGTAGTIALWTTSTNLGNSILTQTGTSAVTLGAGAFNFTQVAAPSLSAANFGKAYFDSTSKTLKYSYNGGAYFDGVRSNYTTGFLPLGGAGGLLGNSYASQTGNNFTLAQPATGVITLGGVTGARPNILLTDTTGVTEIRGGTTDLGFFDGGNNIARIGTGRDQVQTSNANGQVNLGDLVGAGNLTNGSFDDVNQIILFGAGTATGRWTFTVNGASSLVTADVNGSAELTLSGLQGAVTTTVGANTSTANIEASAPAGTLKLGDINGNGNGTSGRFDDQGNAITLNGNASNQVFVDGGAVSGTPMAAIGDPAGSGNGTAVKVFDNLSVLQLLAPGGLLTSDALTVRFSNAAYQNCGFLYTDSAGSILCNPGTPAVTLSGNTASLGGGALLAGACTSGTVNIVGVTTAMGITATPVTYPGDAVFWKAYASSPGQVTVKVCAAIAATPTASVYNVRVIQ